MDAGIAAIAAAIISGLASTLTAIVVAQVNARSQTEIIQALASNATGRAVGAVLGVISSKPSISLRLLRAISWFLIIFLRVLGVIALMFVYAGLGPYSGDVHYSISPQEPSPWPPNHDSTILPTWVFLFSACFALVVSVIAKHKLHRISPPQSN
jgi:hypothetical protein